MSVGTSHQWLHQWLYDVQGSNHMCTQICMCNLAMEVILANMVQIKFHRHSVSVLWGIYMHHVSLLNKVARRFQKLTSYVRLYQGTMYSRTILTIPKSKEALSLCFTLDTFATEVRQIMDLEHGDRLLCHIGSIDVSDYYPPIAVTFVSHAEAFSP